MRKDIDLILSAITKDILQQLHILLASELGINTKVGFNTLETSSLDRNIQATVNEEQIDIDFPFYIVYLEWDRPKKYGKQPPVDVIIKWLEAKGIAATAKNIRNVKSLAFIIARSIWLEGWKGRVIAGLNRDFKGESPLDKYIEQNEDRWFDELFEALMKDLDKYFTD